MRRLSSPLRRSVSKLGRDRRGNVAITFAVAAVPIVFALGMTVDYGYAVKVRAKLNAAADAAALSAVTTTGMLTDTATAKAMAARIFNAQVGAVPRLLYDPSSNPTVTISDGVVQTQRVRTATVSYKAMTSNAFGGVLGRTSIAIAGTSSASASTSPNIDFFLMLDTSPSMAIPSSPDGIATMVKNTPYQDGGAGCAFACHESNPAAESVGGTRAKPIFGNPGCPDDPKYNIATCWDNYAIARYLGVTLRMDLVKQAVSNLVDTAATTATNTGAAYQLAGYTFDATTNQAFALQAPTALTKTLANANVNMLVVANENSNNGDQNTVFDDWGTTKGAFTVLRGAMAASYAGAGAGNGTNTLGDHPQQVLMIVTDGVADEPFNGNRLYNPLGGTTTLGSDTNSTCAAIKSNGNIRIAVLYLVYNPLPMVNGQGQPSWYSGHVYPVQSDIAPTLQNCASPGLFYQVNSGGDVSSAMTSLFQSAIKTARLSQ